MFADSAANLECGTQYRFGCEGRSSIAPVLCPGIAGVSKIVSFSKGPPTPALSRPRAGCVCGHGAGGDARAPRTDVFRDRALIQSGSSSRTPNWAADDWRQASGRAVTRWTNLYPIPLVYGSPQPHPKGWRGIGSALTSICVGASPSTKPIAVSPLHYPHSPDLPARTNAGSRQSPSFPARHAQCVTVRASPRHWRLSARSRSVVSVHHAEDGWPG